MQHWTYPRYSIHTACTGTIVVLYGHHDLRCSNTSAEKLRRHNWIVRSFQSGLDLLRLQSTMASVLRLARRTLPDGSPDPSDRSQQQPDLAIYDHHRGGANPTLVDVVVTDPTAPSYRTTSSRRVGAASARAEARKQTRYARQSQESGYRFKPFGVATYTDDRRR